MKPFSPLCLSLLGTLLVSIATQDDSTDIGYRWRAGKFSPCSKTCRGIQRRRVICQGKTPTGIVFEARTELKCRAHDPRSKPIKIISCGNKCLQYKWVAEPYEECNAACGPGIQSRLVVCKQWNGTSEFIVSDQYCKGIKPNTSRSCNSKCNGRHNIVNCRWTTKGYTPCSQSCGGGSQSRIVSCSCSGLDDMFSVESGDAACEITNAGLKPAGLRSCGTTPCRSYSWIVSKWSWCSSVCSEGKRRRQVTCSNGTTRVSDRYCHGRGLRKPSNYQVCRRFCEIVLSRWTDCKTSQTNRANCGERTRTAACIQKRQNGAQKIIPMKHCLHEINQTIPAVQQQCFCQYIYTFSDWSSCSVDCGHGFRYRQVTCTEYSTKAAAKDQQCMDLYGASKPPNKLPCFRYCQTSPQISSPPRSQPQPPPQNTDLFYFIGEEVYAVSGTTVGISCEVQEAESNAHIMWHLPNGTTIVPGERHGRISATQISQTKASVMIDQVNMQDEGSYTCIAKNNLGQMSFSSSLFVYASPRNNCRDKLAARVCEWVSKTHLCTGQLKNSCCQTCAGH